MPSTKIITCPQCGETRRHGAHGLCRVCYASNWSKQNPHGPAPSRECVVCHEVRPHMGFGMCQPCYDHQRYLDNIEQVKIRNAEYYAAHPEQCRTNNIRWRTENPERQRENNRNYRIAHPDRARAWGYRWYVNNKELAKGRVQRRRARRRNLESTLTAAQWRDILIVHPYCYLCGKPFTKDDPATQDHIIALFNNGPHTIHNVLPAHRRCNSRKGVRPAPHPVQPLLI